MRALKILVIAMGVLLVAGVAALGVGIAWRLHHPRIATASPRTVIAPAGMPRSVVLPTGAKLIAAQNDGDRVMLRLSLAEGGEELMLVDWKTGAVLSTLNLK
ncbi:MAG TPA: hypothetical protein VN632_07990 [Stellaceae bacterium]|nr:hypothetical protein [Stellaceae bacterium]